MYRSLSSNDLLSYIPDIPIYTYRDIKRMTTLPQTPFIILYEQLKGLGHWICVLHTPEGIEHFDSYGLKPDDEIKFTKKINRESLGLDHTYLTKLLINSGQNINYSKAKLQGPPPIATCGYHVLTRLSFPNLGSDEYERFIKKLCKVFQSDADTMVINIVKLLKSI